MVEQRLEEKVVHLTVIGKRTEEQRLVFHPAARYFMALTDDGQNPGLRNVVEVSRDVYRAHEVGGVFQAPAYSANSGDWYLRREDALAFAQQD